jgi:hypothetical protein
MFDGRNGRGLDSMPLVDDRGPCPIVWGGAE